MPKSHYLAYLLLSRLISADTAQQDGDIVIRDVCIIGGGSSGTYSAIQLHDMGKSVVVLEREGILGGQVDTYRDPITNATYDFGVKSFITMDVVTNYFTRLGVEWEPASLSRNYSNYVDFSQGQTLPDYTLPNSTAVARKFYQILAGYSYLDHGFFLPDPIPGDLLLPFGDFLQKHDIKSVLNSTWKGLGDIPQQMTLHIISIRRSTSAGPSTYPITVVAQSPSGIKTIRAKTLLISIPPLLSSLQEIGLDIPPAEKSLFSQFTASGYYTSLVRIPPLSSKNITSLLNVAPDAPFNLPVLPCIYSVSKTPLPDLYQIEYGSTHPLPSQTVCHELISSLNATLRATGLLAPNDPDPELVGFASHAPNLLTVPEGAVRRGFYDRLYKLQGRRGTFWTGASFHAHDSSFLWRFSDGVVRWIGDSL